MDYKNDDWLAQQYLVKRLEPEEIAAACGAPVESVRDRIKKNDLIRPNFEYPSISDKALLRWCGENRHIIPDDVQEATIPEDREKTRVVVLGASGFVGRNLMAYLEQNSKYYVLGWGRDDVDLMDRAALDRALNLVMPDVVVNLAAFVGGIGLNRKNPADMIYRNLVMATNVVDACFTCGVRKLVYLGTVCSYPHTPPAIPFQERDLWVERPEPTNEPYGVAKKTIGLMLDAYKRQYNFSSAYLIPTNMYGPDDDFSKQGSHVIPAMIRKFMEARRDKKDTVVHWGDGTATRDFLFVGDCCEAIKLAIEKMDYPMPINIGSGYECAMGELSERIQEATNFLGEVEWDTEKPNGQPRRCLDVSLAYQVLGFCPRTDLQTGLAATVDWYRGKFK